MRRVGDRAVASRAKQSLAAYADGEADCTVALQRALDAASQGSGVVSVPRGNYRFEGHLNVPSGVTLKGVWESVPAHTGIRDEGKPKPTDDGTTFLVTDSAGDEGGEPFITLNTNSILKGICINYPDQKKDEVPHAYPFAIAMRGQNPSVLDVELLNPYNGIDATNNDRHLIRNVHGQPLRRGVSVDSVYDIGRIENVHFNPWWSMEPALLDWQMANGEAFIFGRTDWQYVLNTFCFGYKVGYRFIESPAGVANGNFLGIGADDCWTAVLVENSAPYGVLITNGQFVSFQGPDPTMVEVTEHHTGTVRFSNCAFWGPCNQIAKIAGVGTVGFSDCTFATWDAKVEGRAMLQIESGTLLVRGCEFRDARKQVALGSRVQRALITDNVFAGALQVENTSAGNVVVSNNIADDPTS